MTSWKLHLTCALAGAIGILLTLAAWTLIQDHSRTTLMWQAMTTPRPQSAPPK